MTIEIFPTPQWLSDAVFYQIFPDRFCKSRQNIQVAAFAEWGSLPTAHNFMGGDLHGITAQIPYLQVIIAIRPTIIFMLTPYWVVMPPCVTCSILRMLLA